MSIQIRTVQGALVLAMSVGFLLQAGAQQKFLDKLQNAAKKTQEATQPQGAQQTPQQGTQPAQQRAGGGSLSSALGATEFNALSDHNKCFDPLKGYRSKITGDMLENKLKGATGVSATDRARWQEDLTAVRAAQTAGSDDVKSPDPKDAHRYLNHLTRDEQTELNRQYGEYYNKITSGCNGQDVMGIGKKTPMNYIQGSAAADAQRAAQEKSTDNAMACLQGLSKVRWTVMAEKLQAKMGSQKLSADERKTWEEDIAVVRQAESGATQMPMSPDPKNPMRYMTRLSAEEQAAFNQEVGAKTAERTQQCTSQQQGPAERPIQAGGLVDKSKSPANKNAVAPADDRRNRPPPPGGALGAGNLTGLISYNECYDPLKGHLAKVTADALEAKFAKQASLTAQQRSEWQADVASWRTAQTEGKDAAIPADPANPYRWQDRFTRDERAAINKEHADFNNKIVRDCGSRDSTIGSGGKKR